MERVSGSYRVKEKEMPVGAGTPLGQQAYLVQLPRQARYLRRRQKWQEGRGCGWEKKVGDSKWLYDSDGSDVNGFRVKFTAPGHLFCEYIDRCSYQQMYAGSLGPNCELRYRKGGAQDARW